MKVSVGRSKILQIIYNQFRLRPIRVFLLTISIISILFLSYQLFSVEVLHSEEIVSYRKHLNEQKKPYPQPQVLVQKYSDTGSVPELPLQNQKPKPLSPAQALLLNPNQIPFQSGKPKIPKVLGVSPVYYKYYTGHMLKFHCLTNKYLRLDWNKVNDDYCDCPLDGSDEPSTAACMNGRFYCTKTKENNYADFIPSSRVNDGLCDCCDGSDEYTTGVKCAQNCQRL